MKRMFLTDILAGIANLFASTASSACCWFFFDEPTADEEIL